MLRIAVFCSLQNKNRHDRKLVIGLKQHLLSQQESRGAVDKVGRITDGCAEIARGSGTVLNAKRVISAMPFKSLMAYSECVAVAAGDDFAERRRAAFACSEIKPSGECATRRLHIVETYVNVAFRVVAICRLDIRASAGQVPHCQLADSEMQVFEAGTATEIGRSRLRC